MRQWDIYLCPFEQERPHPVVLVSSDERCANPDLQHVNGLICTSLRLDRPLRKREFLLDRDDGLDWPTAVRCDIVYVLEKAKLTQRRGQVSPARRRLLCLKVAECLRWPLM